MCRRHLYWPLKARGVCGRNTENLIEVLDHKMTSYQQKRYVVMRFIHDEEHIVFKDIGKGRRKKGSIWWDWGCYSYELMLKLEWTWVGT